MSDREAQIRDIDKRIDDLEAHRKMWANAGRSVVMSYGGSMALKAVGEIQSLLSERRRLSDELSAEEYDLNHGTHRLQRVMLSYELEHLNGVIKNSNIIKKVLLKRKAKALESEIYLLTLQDSEIENEINNQKVLKRGKND